MKTFRYTVAGELNDESVRDIFDGSIKIGTVQRVYTNRVKRFFDRHFDYRYFLIYDTKVGNSSYRVKKIFKRGKLWFEGRYEGSKLKSIITYDNWRIGIPELYIFHDQTKIKLEKEFEEPSRFYENETLIATWAATYDEAVDAFHIELIIYDEATIQDPAFYISISQATLFIGA